MSGSRSQNRHPKKSAFSCEACRKRKVKCDATHPICDRCKLRGDDCIYKLSPTLLYTQRLEQKIQQLEAALSAAGSTSSDTALNPTSIDGVASSPSDVGATSARAVDALRVEDDGRLSFHGSTSLFQLPSSAKAVANEANQEVQELAARKESLVNSAWRERAYEKLADIPEPFRSLLDSHFCWIQPLFNFIYRPAFTRDMKNGGPYFSQALLNAVLSHSVRWCRGEPGMEDLLAPFDNGKAFSKRAVTFLFEDVQKGNSKVPTVQALLMLSAQECGCGNRTQAWLYSGMAFRLIDDMGICIDGKRYADAGHFSVEDIEIRNRLFWSCYFWDKLISLYFGRAPLIQHSEISPPRVLMDDTAELEAWTPHGVYSPGYPPKQAYSISCFTHMCGLAEILNQLLINIYNPSQDPTGPRAHQCTIAMSFKLKVWWRDLPNHLKINLADSPLDCPPSHIVTLNCLYHTINILLNRAKLKLNREPKSANPSAENNPLIQCISSATAIVTLFKLYNHTFGEGHVVLSLAYTVYTAASIFLLEVQATGHAAPSTLERLSFCVEALNRLRRTSPAIATASRSISKELEVLGIQISGGAPQATEDEINELHLPRPSATLPLETDLVTAPAGIHQPIAHEEQSLYDLSYLNGQIDESLNYSMLDIPPEMYEAFSQIEPISITMNPGFDVF
ncbi:hypothetical protein BU24DRAFT_445995 [Aaosphaeria arxii CBS 175.79]|uniref:Zn(2)-C6 fungal-type domain-containing protein n=1 Tax=Aaosphaeria arxii CBS 175.79 TaxID=1450172 RepID=A0A6A5Y6L1_9PLEO|nr:uncharacterized protein BU24DRAFT_445995 [Aaosphaeria arxii CBS 175.79]KAF2020853.1 hypothetical protein BU24DRAFT_445995 [Aaosphaeria arxii CBS 175.79]